MAANIRDAPDPDPEIPLRDIPIHPNALRLFAGPFPSEEVREKNDKIEKRFLEKNMKNRLMSKAP